MVVRRCFQKFGSITYRVGVPVEIDERALSLCFWLCRRPACHSCSFRIEAFVCRSIARVSGGMVVEERGLDAHGHCKSTLGENERMCAGGQEQRVICEWNARRRSRPGLLALDFAENRGMLTGRVVDTATILSRQGPARASVCVTLFSSARLTWIGNSASHDRLRMMASFLPSDSNDALSTSLLCDQAQKVP
jgi:hypothetical protein